MFRWRGRGEAELWESYWEKESSCALCGEEREWQQESGVFGNVMFLFAVRLCENLYATTSLYLKNFCYFENSIQMVWVSRLADAMVSQARASGRFSGFILSRLLVVVFVFTLWLYLVGSYSELSCSNIRVAEICSFSVFTLVFIHSIRVN